MPELTITMQNREGLQGRPAARFIDTARQFNSAINITHKDQTLNARRNLSLFSSGVFVGSTRTTQAESNASDLTICSLRTLIESSFGEAQ
jgi:phosphotransferase system HPr (HPr) family protein